MTLDTRAARGRLDEWESWLKADYGWASLAEPKALALIAEHRVALDALDAAESRYAQLSALVDTWQRRFNLELQRALAAESRIDALEAALTEIARDNAGQGVYVAIARAVLAGEGNE